MKPAFGQLLAAALFCTVPVLSSAAAEPDFIPLLDAGHSEGWRQCGDTEMRLNNGEATTRAPNDKARGVYWYANRPFRDFVIRLEYSLDGPTSNSGLFVRFPELGNDPQVASNEGYEIQIYGSAEGRNPTGAIWGFQPPTSAPQRMKGWNEMEVTVVGQHFTVVLNGQTVNDFTGTRRTEGYIGLQDYPGAPVHLRNVRIKELSSAPQVPGPSGITADLVKTHRNNLVFVNGSNGAGSGFLAKDGDGVWLFTNAHVAAGVQGAGFKTLQGDQVQVGAAAVAVGHDIVRMKSTADQPLEIMTEVDKNTAIGDDIVVLGNSEGAGVINTIMGKIVGVGPNLVEVDAPFKPGNSGSPIIHLKSGKVIGIATYLTIRKFDSATKQPVKAPIVRRFGYRIDSVKTWQPVQWPAFLAQARRMEAIDGLTQELVEFLDNLSRGKITSGNSQIKNRIDAWVASRARKMSPSDRQTADENFISFLKVTCQADIIAAQGQFTYDYFQRELTERERIRKEMAGGFEKLLKEMHHSS